MTDEVLALLWAAVACQLYILIALGWLVFDLTIGARKRRKEAAQVFEQMKKIFEKV